MLWTKLQSKETRDGRDVQKEIPGLQQRRNKDKRRRTIEKDQRKDSQDSTHRELEKYK